MPARECYAQRVRFPTTPPPAQTQAATIPANTMPQLPNTIPPYSGGGTAFPQIPNYNSPTIAPLPNTAPAATIAPPNFDGFSSQPGFTYPPPPAYPGQPPIGFSGGVQPLITPPDGTAGVPAYPQNPPYLFPNPTFPSMPAISRPSTWFDGWSWPGSAGTNSQSSSSGDWLGRTFWSKFEKGPYLRLFQEFRFGQTFLAGNDGTELQINDTELGTTLNYPNFFFSGEPLRISPGFDFHLWDGPVSPPADLPARAYSSFLAFDFSSPADLQFGADINFSIGLYSDFHGLTSDALRFKGAGLGRIRLAPDLTFRFGVVYWDRVQIKILPAFGFFWTPTPDARMEIFFPYPKLARRFPQLGNNDIWGYIRGEYGGDTFSIERTTGAAAGLHDEVDIIDYRIIAGVEWTSLNGATGFFEGGYVFGRELAYKNFPSDNIDIDSTFMFRTGISY